MAREATPRAYGVAPIAGLEGREVVAGIWPGEGVWLGFQPVDRSSPAVVRVLVEGELEHRLVCPPDHALPGLFSEGSFTVLAGEEDLAEVTIRLVSAHAFTGMTGVPMEPIDPESGFRGQRLP